jgi:hypothetical protein
VLPLVGHCLREIPRTRRLPADSTLKLEFSTQIELLRSMLQQIAGADALTAAAREGGSGGAYAALPGRMANEQLAHELLLDPTFQLDESRGAMEEIPVFHRIREWFHWVVFSDSSVGFG